MPKPRKHGNAYAFFISMAHSMAHSRVDGVVPKPKEVPRVPKPMPRVPKPKVSRISTREYTEDDYDTLTALITEAVHEELDLNVTREGLTLWVSNSANPSIKDDNVHRIQLCTFGLNPWSVSD